MIPIYFMYGNRMMMGNRNEVKRGKMAGLCDPCDLHPLRGEHPQASGARPQSGIHRRRKVQNRFPASACCNGQKTGRCMALVPVYDGRRTRPHRGHPRRRQNLHGSFLADEINRTSAKTQSAFLEVMEEGTVTVLPESQLDRFLICIQMGYPSDADDSMADYLQKNCPSVPDEDISRLQALILNASYEQLPPYEPTAKPATNQTAKDNNIHLTMVKR